MNLVRYVFSTSSRDQFKKRVDVIVDGPTGFDRKVHRSLMIHPHKTGILMFEDKLSEIIHRPDFASMDMSCYSVSALLYSRM